MHTNNECVEDIAQELVTIYHAQAHNKKQKKTDVIWANLKLEVFSCVKHKMQKYLLDQSERCLHLYKS